MLIPVDADTSYLEALRAYRTAKRELTVANNALGYDRIYGEDAQDTQARHVRRASSELAGATARLEAIEAEVKNAPWPRYYRVGNTIHAVPRDLAPDGAVGDRDAMAFALAPELSGMSEDQAREATGLPFCRSCFGPESVIVGWVR